MEKQSDKYRMWDILNDNRPSLLKKKSIVWSRRMEWLKETKQTKWPIAMYEPWLDPVEQNLLQKIYRE